MEDEDFGFARRTDNVLRKVCTVSGGQKPDDRGTLRAVDDARDRRIRSPPKTSEVVGCGGGSTTPAPPIAAGSDGRERASTAGSVVPNTPDIPNVVEYHLKVKPRSTARPCRLDSVSRGQSREEMKEEVKKNTASSVDENKDLARKLSRLSMDNVYEGSTDLPQMFQVRYLGSHDARGLWGIKHTRKPVDNMVSAAKALPTNTMLPLIKLVVSQGGVTLLPLDKRKQDSGSSKRYPIDTISYGVQDLVYTRVFSMIVVQETDNCRRIAPFECHGFVCESRYHARQLTHALATAFEIYSRIVRSQGKRSEVDANAAKRRLAIDLRSPEEIEADLTMDSEA